jgi:hypothetical protein
VSGHLDVYVPIPRGRASLAVLVLQAEGVRHTPVQIPSGSTSYAAWLADTWEAGDGFVVVEYDIAPYVGAVDALAFCQEPWCVHRYPTRAGSVTWALGLVKFSTPLVRSRPGLGDEWRDVDWQSLDGAVINTLRRGAPHVHEPAVAHAQIPH